MFELVRQGLGKARLMSLPTTLGSVNVAKKQLSDAAALRAAESIHQPRDPNTLSNYNAWRTKHTTANLDIDFDRKRLKGRVELTLERLATEERNVILDTRYGSDVRLQQSVDHVD